MVVASAAAAVTPGNVDWSSVLTSASSHRTAKWEKCVPMFQQRQGSVADEL